MVRSALGPQSGARLNKGPRAGADYVPAATVVAGSLLSLLPVVSATGWWPDFAISRSPTVSGLACRRSRSAAGRYERHECDARVASGVAPHSMA